MTPEEEIKMIEDLEMAVQDVNSYIDALIANKVKVHVGVIMQGDAFDGYKPTIETNSKKLLYTLDPVGDFGKEK